MFSSWYECFSSSGYLLSQLASADKCAQKVNVLLAIIFSLFESWCCSFYIRMGSGHHTRFNRRTYLQPEPKRCLFELFLEEVQMMDRVDCGSVLVLYQNPDSLRTPPQIDFKGCYQNGWELLANFR